MIKEIGKTLAREVTDELLDYFNLVSHNEDSLNKSKTTINRPTGDFFYDPWEIDPDFKGSIYEKVLDSLDIEIGEARLIVMKPGTCYHSHADIDDRYHLNIQGQYSYLINLDQQQMYPTVPDGVWYTMDASPRHVAANFGSVDRIQLVVRQLLKRNILENPVNVNIMPNLGVEKPRFVMDDVLSPWLNRAVKKGILNNFKTDLKQIWFDIEYKYLSELITIVPDGFIITNQSYNAK